VLLRQVTRLRTELQMLKRKRALSSKAARTEAKSLVLFAPLHPNNLAQVEGNFSSS
jgi:hypothetical protein